MDAKEIKRIDLLKNETFWMESLENAAYAETYSKSTSKDPMKAMMFKAVDLMNELVAELEAKSKEQQPEVSDERIEDLWYNHAGAEHNGGLLNLMTREDFEAALNKLNK